MPFNASDFDKESDGQYPLKPFRLLAPGFLLLKQLASPGGFEPPLSP